MELVKVRDRQTITRAKTYLDELGIPFLLSSGTVKVRDRQTITRAKTYLDELGIPFLLSSGTCLDKRQTNNSKS